MREKIASFIHDTWAHWMAYVLLCCHHNPDGTMTIPKELVERWKRQMATKYPELSAVEQHSDQRIADIFILLIGGIRHGKHDND